MISIVNTDCYKNPPVQTLALFAKLLTPVFEEMTVCVAAQRPFYRRSKAVKGLLMMPVFAHFELWQVSRVTETNNLLSLSVQEYYILHILSVP